MTTEHRDTHAHVPGRDGPLPADAGPAAPVVEAADLSKWYGDVVAVAEVSFRIYPGVTALLGPNGAGKSTLLKMMTGMVRPSTGAVRVLGRPLRADPGTYRRMGVLSEEEEGYPFLTGREFVRLNAVLHGLREPDAAARRALAEVDLLHDADRPLGGYSKGMRQRAKLAAALVHDPDVLFLDEPLNGMDPRQRVHVIDLIHRLEAQGRTVVISSHVLQEVERFASRILVVVNGRLAAAGDYQTIRDRLQNHARTVRVRATEVRRLAAGIVGLPSVRGVRVEDGSAEGLVIETDDVRDVCRRLPALARAEGVRLYEIAALDDSLASVFTYVTGH